MTIRIDSGEQDFSVPITTVRIMTDNQSSLNRRRFLVTSSAAGVAGVAGCTDLENFVESEADDDMSGFDDTSLAPDADDPEELLSQFYNVLYAPQTEYAHSVLGDTELHAVETSLEEEGIDQTELIERTSLDEEDAETVAQGETAIVEVTVDVTEMGERQEITDTWLVGTEDEEWRLVEELREEPTGEPDDTTVEEDTDTEPVDESLQVVSAVGRVSDADSGSIDRIELVVSLAPGSSPVDLGQIRGQYVSEAGAAELIHVGHGGENTYGIKPVRAANEETPVIETEDERYTLVIPLTDGQEIDGILGDGIPLPSSLEPLNRGERAEIELHTQSGAVFGEAVVVPDTIDQDFAGDYVEL